MFVQENIEKLKREWTDKYVMVAGDRPELRRFDGYTGQVKTVNMSGRALVQFDAWNNIGWYDIDPNYLTVVPKPEPGAGRKVVENDKAAAPKKVPPKQPAGEKPAAAKPTGKPGRLSVAEMLAAARANKPAASSAPAASEPAAPAAVAEQPSAEKPAAKRAAEKSVGGTMLPKGQRPTVAQMVAFCRERDSNG